MKIKERNCRLENGSLVAEGWYSPRVRHPAQNRKERREGRRVQRKGQAIGQSGIK